MITFGYNFVKNFFGLKQDIFICYMYNHPADSPYSRALDLDYFDVLEKEITDFSRQGQIILGGDLNARSGSLSDFITEDNDDHLPFLMITTQTEKEAIDEVKTIY